MGRRLRYLPYETNLVEITNRTIHARLLLSPSRELNRIIVGALARAQKRYRVEIHAFVFLSNHYHLLASFRDVDQMARFAGYFQSRIAKEVKRLTGWGEKIWGRRFTPIVVSQEEAAQVSRLEYLLSQGVKEGFVTHPAEWPGAHSVRELLEGTQAIRGIWRDRTAEHKARRHKQGVRSEDFHEEEVLELTPLPCWRELSEGERREAVRDLIDTIVNSVEDAPDDRKSFRPSARPSDRPRRSKRSPAPWFHCATRAVRQELMRAYREFLAAYRDAAARLRAGELTAPFPDGCFPPPRAWVRSAA